MDVARLRADLPALSHCIHLNSGGISPTLAPVTEEILECYRLIGERGYGTPELMAELEQRRVEEARGAIARLFRVTPEEIAFTRSISEGISTVAWGLPWRPGDEVVMTDQEHPSGYLPVLNQARRSELVVRRVSVVDDPVEFLAALEGALTPRTRLLMLSHVTTDTGHRLPAEAICQMARRRGIRTLFDGAQSAGQIAIDLRALDCDYYTFNGYKWMLGPRGAAVLYVKRERQEELEPSWTGSYAAGSSDRLSDDFEFRETAQRYEFGSRSGPLLSALGKAAAYLDEVGLADAEARSRTLAAALKRQLTERPGVEVLTPLAPEASTGIVTFAVAGIEGGTLARQLWERGRVLCRSAMGRGVRLSLACFITEKEISAALAVVDEFRA